MCRSILGGHNVRILTELSVASTLVLNNKRCAHGQRRRGLKTRIVAGQWSKRRSADAEKNSRDEEAHDEYDISNATGDKKLGSTRSVSVPMMTVFIAKGGMLGSPLLTRPAQRENRGEKKQKMRQTLQTSLVTEKQLIRDLENP